MIDGNEDQTHELTEYELRTILPKVVKQMKTKIGKEKAVTNKHVVQTFKFYGYQLSEPRFRKIVQHIRVNGLIPGLVSHGKGYFVATKRSDVEMNIRRLDQKINAEIITRDSLHYQMKQMFDRPDDDDPFN